MFKKKEELVAIKFVGKKEKLILIDFVVKITNFNLLKFKNEVSHVNIPAVCRWFPLSGTISHPRDAYTGNYIKVDGRLIYSDQVEVALLAQEVNLNEFWWFNPEKLSN